MKSAFIATISITWLFIVKVGPATGQTTSQAEPPTYKQHEIEAMLDYLLHADDEARLALSRKMKPTLKDCELIFSGPYARKIYRQQKLIRRQSRVVLKPLIARQTDFRYWQATAKELSLYEGDAPHFPGGYRELASFLNPELTYYRFKFIEPGHKMGSAYDMLTFVNGRWVLILRPWAVMF